VGGAADGRLTHSQILDRFQKMDQTAMVPMTSCCAVADVECRVGCAPCRTAADDAGYQMS
jgi:hypothetical protein